MLTVYERHAGSRRLDTIAGGQPDNEEAYPLFNSGDVAAAIMPFWQTSRYTSYMTDLKGKVAIAAPPVWGDKRTRLRPSAAAEQVPQLWQAVRTQTGSRSICLYQTFRDSQRGSMECIGI